MDDLAVKLFMAENALIDYDVAVQIMDKYGLADEYEDTAGRLQFLLTEGNDENAFVEGIAFAKETVESIHFHLSPDLKDTALPQGIQIAMEQVVKVLQAAVDGATMTDEQVDQEARITDAVMEPLDLDVVKQTIERFFGESAKR